MTDKTDKSRADLALEQLDKWERHIEAMTPGDQALIAIAKGSFARWLEQHGQPGKIAVQLSLLADVVNAADPTILQ